MFSVTKRFSLWILALKEIKQKTYCGFPWVETSTAGRVYDLCVYYMTGAPEGSPKVVLCGFLWFYGEAGNRTPLTDKRNLYPIVNIFLKYMYL